MGTMTWWILGALVVGGGAVAYFATKDGKTKPANEVCLKDLTEPFFSQVKKAMDAKDVAALNAYALEAHGKKWTCAANELAAAAKRFESEKKKIDTTGPAVDTTDLVMDPVDDPAKVTPVASPTLGTVEPSSPTSKEACAAKFAARNGEEQATIIYAINKIRQKGDTSMLNDIAQSYDDAGEKDFATCLRYLLATGPKSLSAPKPPVTAADMEDPVNWFGAVA